jgi:hypothetical protein
MSQESCEICELDITTVEQVKQLYQSGQEPEEIGITLGIDFESLQKHCHACIKRPRSQQERYRELIDQLEEDVGHARQAMIKRPDSPGLQQGYARIVTEYRDAISKNEDLIKPEDTVTDLIVRVINPLIRETLKGITEEIAKLRGELQAAGIAPDIAAKLLEEFFKRSAIRLKATTTGAVINMNSYFGAVDDPMKKDRTIEKTIQ